MCSSVSLQLSYGFVQCELPLTRHYRLVVTLGSFWCRVWYPSQTATLLKSGNTTSKASGGCSSRTCFVKIQPGGLGGIAAPATWQANACHRCWACKGQFTSWIAKLKKNHFPKHLVGTYKKRVGSEASICLRCEQIYI